MPTPSNIITSTILAFLLYPPIILATIITNTPIITTFLINITASIQPKSVLSPFLSIKPHNTYYEPTLNPSLHHNNQ